MAAATESKEFVKLVDELSDLEQERTGSGGLSGESAARRARVERRLMQLLGTDIEADERRKAARVPTNMKVQVKAGDTTATGRVADVGTGGAFVASGLKTKIGDVVDIEVERARGSLQHGFHLRGKVAWLDGKGFGVAFHAAAEADERRLRRFVLDILREHLPSGHA